MNSGIAHSNGYLCLCACLDYLLALMCSWKRGRSSISICRILLSCHWSFKGSFWLSVLNLIFTRYVSISYINSYVLVAFGRQWEGLATNNTWTKRNMWSNIFKNKMLVNLDRQKMKPSFNIIYRKIKGELFFTFHIKCFYGCSQPVPTK